MIPTPRTARSSIPSSTALAARLLSLYPVLAELPPALRDGALATQAGVHKLPEGKLLFEQGTPCMGLPLVAHGVTVTATELVVLSPAAFARWTAHEPFHRYVYGSFADRLADMMTLVEAVAFQQLDQRLAAALLGHGATILRTHQSLADELGTVRDVVTRQLTRFERDGWIGMGRERVDILDASALRAQAGGPAAR